MEERMSARARERAPFPLVIGVTGHRDLRDVDLPGLKRVISDLFRELQGRCPHSPLQLLTPLAEGADRIAAESALACNVQIVVPLPMPEDIYKSDFETPGSIAEFDRLLAEARESFVLPPAEGNTLEKIRTGEGARVRQYGLLGAYIVRNSHALLALWDGVHSEKSNGTSDVVGFKLHGVSEEFVPDRTLFAPVESDPVWHIVTPRVSNPSPSGKPLTMRTIFPPRFGPPEEGERRFNALLEVIEGHNRSAMS